MKILAMAPESLFWYWINERHRIYIRKTMGDPKPWTTDSILRDYKFTNVFRELDRGTVWLRENFIQPHWNDDPGLIVANVAWYRMFNYWGTGEYLGWQDNPWTEPGWKEFARVKLHIAMAEGRQVFTNAHIIWSEEGKPKIDAIVDYAANVWAAREDIADTCSLGWLQTVFEKLTSFRGIGDFQAYEITTDLRHTRLLDHATDINTWANAGPGALRGLRRLGLPAKNQKEALESMRGLLLDSEFSLFPPRKFSDIARLEPHVPTLELRDIEHSLCEFDKFCRVKFDEGEPRMKYNGRA